MVTVKDIEAQLVGGVCVGVYIVEGQPCRVWVANGSRGARSEFEGSLDDLLRAAEAARRLAASEGIYRSFFDVCPDHGVTKTAVCCLDQGGELGAATVSDEAAP